MRYVDLHCDTISAVVQAGANLRTFDGHINLDKLKKGDALAQFFAIFIPTNDAAAEGNITLNPTEFFDLVYDGYLKNLEMFSDTLAPAYCYDDIMANAKAGKISSILTIEDGVPLYGSMENLEMYYKKGVRLITLTWNYENSLGFPNSRDPERMKLGLKPFGIEAVRRMNELGILIDVSHLSDGGFYDVAKYSQKPFVASHSCARALCNHPRCMTDDMLHLLGEKGGVCGINFCAGFLNEGASYTAVEDVVRHALHIRDKAGLEALALGSDFDGIGSTLEFKDYTGMPVIERALAKHFTPSELDKIAQGNALRVIRESMK